MQLTFLGAAQTVTGSRYLLKHAGQRILIDCGLFQGLKELRLKNREPFPMDPAELDAILITHAHIDHSGYLPVLVKQGFRGKIYVTQATYDLCEVLLMDAAYLQEEDAARANRYGYSKHHPATPLFTRDDVRETLNRLIVVPFGEEQAIFPEATVSWHRAGHILGASMIKIQTADTSIVFTGDLGRPNDPLMKPPAIMQDADYVVLDSTYGERLHDQSDPMNTISEVIDKTAMRGGTTLIPSFAVGRAQVILYYLYHLKEAERLPKVPIYFDSPMAIKATQIFEKYPNDHNLSRSHALAVCRLPEYVETPEESKAIDQQPMPKIILSASGMATGGRVLHHLKVLLPDPENTILFAGFQVPGTRGAKLVQGVNQIKIHGEYYPVRANIEILESLSAHADYNEKIEWLSHLRKPPRKIFLTHGDKEATLSLKEHIDSAMKTECHIPHFLEEVNL